MIESVATWFTWYVLTGIFFSAATLLAFHGLDKKKWLRIGAGKILKDWPVVVLLLLFWPGLVIGGIYVKLRPAPAPKVYFRCQRKNLIKQVTRTEAEAAAKVVDPLHRVPDVPFGLLNQGWLNFVVKMKSGDKLWEFAIPSDPPGATGALNGAMRGYALARGRTVKAEFIYEWN